jgi:hypothetical protein
MFQVLPDTREPSLCIFVYNFFLLISIKDIKFSYFANRNIMSSGGVINGLHYPFFSSEYVPQRLELLQEEED